MSYRYQNEAARSPEQTAAIKSAVAFLSKELTAGLNADAARALLESSARGVDIGGAADPTVDVLRVPSQWDAAIKGEDRRLAHVKFAAALVAAERAGKAPMSSLVDAAKMLAGDQQRDGTWTVEPGTSSAAVCSQVLTAAMGRAALIAAGREPDDFTVVQVDRFLRGLPVDGLADAAATILGLDVGEDMLAETVRANALRLLREAQGADGGFGPDADSSRSLVSALAMVAFSLMETDPRLARKVFRPDELREAVARGRAGLTALQRPDGSWPPPPGGDVRAERIATTAWALQALVGMK